MSKIQGFNIVILPSEEVKKQAIEWSEKLSRKFPTKFTLDGKTYHPHLTLYQSNFPENNNQEIVSSLANLVKNTKPFSLTLNEIHPYVDFVFYHAEKSRELQTFHETLVDVLNPLRDPKFSVPPELVKDFPANFGENITKYGYALAKGDFLPHITLSRISTMEEAEQAASFLSPKPLTMEVSAIYLTNVDHDGTCTKVVEKFRFT